MSVRAEGEGAAGVPGRRLEPVRARVRLDRSRSGAASTIEMRNRIPFARGLGSSAATIAAGVAAGLAWQGSDGRRAAGGGRARGASRQRRGRAARRGDAGVEPPRAARGRCGWAPARSTSSPSSQPASSRPSGRGRRSRRRSGTPTRCTRRRGPRCSWPPSSRGARTRSPTRSTTACTSPIARRSCRCLRRCASGSRACRPSAPRSRGPARRCSSGASRARRRRWPRALGGLGARALPLAVAERGVTVE